MVCVAYIVSPRCGIIVPQMQQVYTQILAWLLYSPDEYPSRLLPQDFSVCTPSQAFQAPCFETGGGKPPSSAVPSSQPQLMEHLDGLQYDRILGLVAGGGHRGRHSPVFAPFSVQPASHSPSHIHKDTQLQKGQERKATFILWIRN